MENGKERPYRAQCFTKEGTAVSVAAATRHVNYRGRTVRMIILSPHDNTATPLPELGKAEPSPRQLDVLHRMAQGFTDSP